MENSQFIVWHPHLRHSTPSKISLDVHLVASRDSMPLDSEGDEMARLCLREFGLQNVIIDTWKLAEFASPYYGYDPFSESWDLRIGRAWNLTLIASSTTGSIEPSAPDAYPTILEITESVRMREPLQSIGSLPLVAIADGATQDACVAATRDLLPGIRTSVLDFEVYSQLRIDINTYPVAPLDALDKFIDVCDEHELSVHWREFVLRFS